MLVVELRNVTPVLMCAHVLHRGWPHQLFPLYISDDFACPGYLKSSIFGFGAVYMNNDWRPTALKQFLNTYTSFYGVPLTSIRRAHLV